MMYNNSEEALWRRKLEEQADLQQALELHSKRLMNLELNMKRSQHNRTLSAGASPFPSPVKGPSFNQSLTVTDCTSPDGAVQENGSFPSADNTQTINDTDREKYESSKEDYNDSNEDCSLPESLEHNLPDSPFASPTKDAAKNVTTFTNAAHVGPASPRSSLLSSSLLPTTSTLDLSTSFKSCYFQMPRFPAGHGTIGM